MSEMPVPGRTRWPDPASLELLVLVAEHGSLGAAAAVAGTTQPSVSRRLDQLERQLGLRLLIRSTTGSRLTEHGQVVVDWARAVLASNANLISGVSALRRERVATLRVGASMTIAEYLIPGWLVALQRAMPEVDVSLQVANSEAVGALVRQREVDVGFVESLSTPSGLNTRPVGIDRLVVVVAPLHPWAARRHRPLTVTELAATPMIVREPGSGTREVFERLLRAAHAPPVPPRLELSSNAAVKVAVLSGVAPACLSILAVAAELRERRLVEIPVEGIELRRSLRAVWLDRQLAGPAASLVRVAAAHRSPPAR